MIDRRLLFTHIILLLLITSVSSEKVTPIGSENSIKTDFNLDKISDFSTLLINRAEVVDEVIVMLNPGYPSKILDSFAQLGFPLVKEWRNFNTISVRGNFAKIDRLLDSPWVKLVEEVQELKPHMMYSSSQMNARGKLWDLGLTGKGETVAVMDTGVDDSHPFLKDKIIAWNDFVGKSVSVSGDNYATPTDKFGHGTHVASIIAGDGSSLQSRKVSFFGTFPDAGFIGLAGETPRLSSTTNIELGVDWGAKGEDVSSQTKVTFYITTIQDPGTLVTSKSTDTSGLDSVTVTLGSGKYLVWVGGGTPGANYDMWINGPNDSGLPSTTDDYSPYNGIAPEANIVGVKVLDDEGTGDTTSFLDGFDWVLTKKDELNITVVNMSFGTDQIVASLDNAVNNLAQQGIVPVVSAGNDGPTTARVGSPGSAQLAITVGAVNKFNEIAYYSSKGSSDNPTVKPDIVAPGGSPLVNSLGDQTGYTDGYGVIYAADTNDRNLQAQDNDLVGYFGTSMSAPHISGLAVILVQKMKQLGLWTPDQTGVGTVKTAILSTGFEVANIGNGGGESFSGGADPNPTIERTGKDSYEGWGMVNAYAAVSFFDKYAPINSPFNLTLDLDDPFVPSSYAFRLHGGNGRSYTITMDVPAGIDADLVVFKSTPSTIGDPLVFASSTNVGTNSDESLTMDLTIDDDLILVVKAVSGTALKNVTVEVQSDFTPSMTINSPSTGDFLKADEVLLDFDSTTSYGRLYMNGTYIGEYQTGTVVNTGVGDGYYNLTIAEVNDLSGTLATQTVWVDVDSQPPVINSTNLLSVVFNETIVIDYEVSDNFGVDTVNFLVDGEVAMSSTNITGSFVFDTQGLPFGDITIALEVVDTVGYTTILERDIFLNHSIYLEMKQDLVLEGSDTVSFTWGAGALSPDNYVVYLNGTILDSVSSWDGSSLSIMFDTDPTISFPVYNVTAQVFDTKGKNITQTIFVSFVDTTSPVLDVVFPDTEYDLTEGAPEVKVTIWDFDLSSYSLDATPFADIVLVSTKADGRTVTLVYRIDNTQIGDKIDLTMSASDGNYQESTLTSKLEVDDRTKPVIDSIAPVSAVEGVSTIITWKYTELFPDSLTLKDDNGTLLASENNPQPSSTFEYDLKDLSAGSYKLKFTITDLGGNAFSSSVRVEISESSGSGSTNDSLLPVVILPMIVALVVIRRRT